MPPTQPYHNASADAPKCAVLLDRHVHKNGGSTMRDLFLENERLGYGLYHGYNQVSWSSHLKHALVRHPPNVSAAGSRFLVMFEAHFGAIDNTHSVLKEINAWAAGMRAAGTNCKVVSVARVRDPLAFYLSFYRWGVGFRQLKPDRRFGRNFTDWVRQNKNLQASITLSSANAVTPEYFGRLNARFDDAKWATLQAFLDSFSIVGSVKRFDETLLLAADAVGLPVVEYKKNKPTLKGGFKLSPQEICPDMDYCRRVVHEVAPYDHLMFDKYNERFERRLGALGAAFEERVRLFQARIQEVKPLWMRVPRKQYLCRYHPETTLNGVLNVNTPANLRCPLPPGSLPICRVFYARRLFECPWQFKLNSSLSDEWGCWKPSSGFKRL